MKFARFTFLTLVMTLMCVSVAFAAQNNVQVNVEINNYVQQFDNGKIDWQTGMVTATGIGAPPAKSTNIAQARAMATRAATVVARRNLLEIVKGVQIDSATAVEDFIATSDVIVSQVKGFLQNSQILDTAYMSDGSVEVTVGVSMNGGLAEVVVPKSVPFRPVAGPAPAVSAPSAPSAPMADGKYTGLVIDARGLQAKPAMNPKITDLNGNEIYGTALVSRDYALQQGMAGYAKDPAKAAQNSRVTDRPLVVKAVSAAGKAKTDLAISPEDAMKVKALAQEGGFLEKCRVMIVLD